MDDYDSGDEEFGGDDEDDLLSMDAMEVHQRVGALNLVAIAAYRKHQNERALKRRLINKVRGLQALKRTRIPSLLDTVSRYPDFVSRCKELLSEHGHGASKWRNTTSDFGLHRSKAKGAGYVGIWRALCDDGYEVGYSTVVSVGKCYNSRIAAKKHYRGLVDMKLIRMCKRAKDFNVDSKHQVCQYKMFNMILERLQCSEEEEDKVILQRGDHATVRTGSGATTNQRRILQATDFDSRVDEYQHDYCNPLATKLQATATYLHGLGVDGDKVKIPPKQLVHCKALQVNPSTSTQLLHDLYCMIQDPDNKRCFHNSDGSIKRVWHVRVDGGENESVNVEHNNILWTEFAERAGVEVLVVSHNESGGNTRELIERTDASKHHRCSCWLGCSCP